MDGLEENNANLSLDSSTKIWLILYQEGSDPGFEFEIFNKNCLIRETTEILERGAHVKVKRENCTTPAIVVAVSDDLKYLEEIFPTVTEDFLNGRQNENNNVEESSFIKSVSRSREIASQRVDVELPFRSSIEQTIDNSILIQENSKKMQLEIDLLKAKYLELERSFKAFKGSITTVPETETTEFAEPNVSKSNVLKPVNTVNIDDGERATTSKNADVEIDEEGNKYVSIGKNKTLVLKDIIITMNWTSYTTATRKLLTAVFPRHVLATHSLTGKPSPAFIGANKKIKARLDPLKISDIVEIVSARSKVSASMVRSAITTKCADENKMERKRKRDAENKEGASKKFRK